ncbi:MAG: LLM class flavin-dependent oxidoreductase, partial [Gemmatimonadetes bacterium]|nr:LLM class flavin-dependent oxidoreductase [Gemmatimonadota bacterium]
ARANRLAHHLRGLGVGPGTIVGVCAERSLELMVGLMGILKAGGAYLPLDPAYPADRVAFMLEDSGAPVLLTQERLLGRLPAGHTAHVLCLDRDWPAVARQSAEAPAPSATPDDLAYTIYTSGSTGKPKGVMVQHGNVANFFTGMDPDVAIGEPGVWLAVTSISFDISVLELFWTLSRGYKVVIQGDDDRAPAAARPEYAKRTLDFSLFYFGGDGATDRPDKYRLLMEGARFADRNGFSAVWTPERHFHQFGGLFPNPSVLSAAIAAVTERIHIRAGSVVLPLHNPVRVAEEWSVVDNISGGRVGISVASGWHDRDFIFQPENYARRKEVMFEGIDTVRRLWRGEKVVQNGGAGTPVEISILPKPIQKELPIWVTAAGSPETYMQAGQSGSHLLTHLLGQSVDQLREKISLYREAWRAAGHEGEGHVALMMHTFVGTDVDEVRELVRKPFREYLRTSVDLIRGLAQGRGQDMRSADFTAEDMEALLDHAFERYFETSALMGTPQSCLAMVDRLKSMGVDEVACLIDFGVDEDRVVQSLGSLAELRELGNPDPREEEEDYTIPAQLRRHGVTHLQCTPSMATMLVAQEEARAAMGSLEVVMIGGEAFPTALAAELGGLVKGRIVNMYGPTETTIWSATHRVRPGAATIPIGRPIANTELYVLDRQLQPVPVGVAGELLIGGAGVVRGYLGRPELTAERFIAHPFRSEGRLYRTGDLARFRPDGTVEFLGRIDHQIKIRGYRIELGEIESLLNAHPAVREAVVVVREDVPGDKRLVAYLVARAGAEIDAAELREILRAQLPEYMVPAHFVVMAALPLTPNAKVDRKALPAPDRAAPAAEAAEYQAPASELERAVAEIWAEVLGVERVGIRDNFFDLGGHSLLTVRVHSRLRATVARNVTITDLFRFPTIQTLVGHLAGA